MTTLEEFRTYRGNEFKICFLGGKMINVIISKTYTLTVAVQSSPALCSSLSRRARHQLEQEAVTLSARHRMHVSSVVG